jgi:hypothetical protein
MSIRSTLVACAVFALAAAPLGTARPPSTLRLVAVSATGSGGEHPGDTLLFTELLYRQGAKKPVGHDEGACIVQSKTALNCSVTFFLPDGKIVVSGVFHFVEQPRLPITGGTGRYADARGWFDFKSLSQTRFMDTFHFTG